MDLMAAPLTQEKFLDSTGVCQTLGEVMELVGEPGLSCFGHAIPQVASGVKLRHAGPAGPAGCFGFAACFSLFSRTVVRLRAHF